MLKAIALLLLVNSALASEHIGESSQYNFEYQGMNGTREESVTSYDADADSYIISSTTTIMGQSTQESEEILAEDMMTHETAAQILAFCSEFGGALENLTVAGSSFTVCKMPIENASFIKALALPSDLKSNTGYIWLGDFPINGIAKLDSPEAKLTLKSFRWNN